MGEIVAVCMSAERGVQKKPVESIELVAGHGIRGDGHAGDWHRQVSLLALESADKLRGRGVEIGPGDFAENVLTRGVDVAHLPIGTRLRAGSGAVLEVTQIGKECHEGCAIREITGDCVMPREGVFCRVLASGTLRSGDAIMVVSDTEETEGADQPGLDPTKGRVIPRVPDAVVDRTSDAPHDPAADRASAYPTALIVLSDSRSSGERKDAVIPAARDRLAGSILSLAAADIIPDDPATIQATLQRFIERAGIALILTSGGTGFAPRDHTPEATRAVLDREAPGLAELLRLRGLEHTPHAMLSRGVAGIAGDTLIINLPGSPKAVREGLDTLLPILPHTLETLRGKVSECADTSLGQGPRTR